MTALARIFRTEVLTVAMKDGVNAPLEDDALRARYVVLTGTLTAVATLVLPRREGTDWMVVNATTGGYAVTVRGTTGSGVLVAPGALRTVTDDGTNFRTPQAAVEAASLTYDASGDLYITLGGTLAPLASWASAGQSTSSNLVPTVSGASGSYITVPAGVYDIRYSLNWYAESAPAATVMIFGVGLTNTSDVLLSFADAAETQNGGVSIVAFNRYQAQGQSGLVSIAEPTRLKLCGRASTGTPEIYILQSSLTVTRVADSLA